MRVSDNTPDNSLEAPTAGASPSPSLGLAGDALRVLLDTPRSDNTRRAYQDDLADLFRYLREPDVCPAAVELLIGMDRARMTVTLRGYMTDLRRRGLAESTVRRRLSSVKKLIETARLLGADVPDPALLSGLLRTAPVVDYRDTRGPDLAEVARILDRIDRATVKGRRDYALLLILATNGLRRGELLAADVRDFDRRAGRLAIIGKGKTQRQWVQLLPDVAAAVAEYLTDRADLSLDAPLFATCDRRDKVEARLTGRGFHDVVNKYGLAVLERPLRPHAFRHTAITEALESTGGDIPTVQDFSRHARPETVMKYRHAIVNGQGEVTRLLGERLRAARDKTAESDNAT
jgi:integrase/recombinase XerC